MIYDHIPDDKLSEIIDMFEKAANHKFTGTRYNQPSLYSRERQEFSGLDINTYIYTADNYEMLKERLNERKRSYQSRQKTVY